MTTNTISIPPPTTGAGLLRWAEAIRECGPRGVAVWWCLWSIGREMGFPGLVTDWDASMVREAWAWGTLYAAEGNTTERGIRWDA